MVAFFSYSALETTTGLWGSSYTDYIDYGVKTELNCDCEFYYKESLRRKKKSGIRFGMQTNTVSEFQKTFDSYLQPLQVEYSHLCV